MADHTLVLLASLGLGVGTLLWAIYETRRGTRGDDDDQD